MVLWGEKGGEGMGGVEEEGKLMGKAMMLQFRLRLRLRYAGQTTVPSLWTARRQATITCPPPHHLLSQDPIHSQGGKNTIWRGR